MISPKAEFLREMSSTNNLSAWAFQEEQVSSVGKQLDLSEGNKFRCTFI
jgi:hypothetical protein